MFSSKPCGRKAFLHSIKVPEPLFYFYLEYILMCCLYAGMASPLIGIAGVNSLLFASYAAARRLISPFPQLSLTQIAGAGAIAGAANAVLASPGQ
jgi:hypothetical protein